MTIQIDNWSGETGKHYTDRHLHSVGEWEQLYVKKFGFTRTQINNMFLDMDRNLKILEVGCNVGNQLIILQNMGFNNLSGIELQEYAVKLAKERVKDIEIIQGSAFNLPFKDKSFDLVFTSGVLIHFAQVDLPKVMNEINRVTNEYIWGFEYYSKDLQEIHWQGGANMMWKADYSKMYLENYKLKLVKELRFRYLTEDNMDSMFLLERV